MSMQASKGGDNWLVGICRLVGWLVGCLIDWLFGRFQREKKKESIIG